MAATTNALITGANRGIGKALLAIYLSRSNHRCIACVRDPSSPTSLFFNDLPVGASSTLIIIPLDSASSTSASTTISTLQSTHNIPHPDIVFANAGICNFTGKVLDIPASELMAHFTTNTLGPLLLFQATLPLLSPKTDKSSVKETKPKFIFVSSAAGSIEAQLFLPFDLTPYAVSKAGCNLLSRKIHAEHENLNVFAVHPGWLKTDMGDWAAKHAHVEMDGAPTTLEEGVQGVIKLVDEATRETTSGGFWNHDGEKLPR